jgi:hypothetical protein
MAQLRRGEEYSPLHKTWLPSQVTRRMDGIASLPPSAKKKKKTHNKQEAKLSGHTLTVAQDNDALRKHP